MRERERERERERQKETETETETETESVTKLFPNSQYFFSKSLANSNFKIN